MSDRGPNPEIAARPATRSTPAGTRESVWKKNGEMSVLRGEEGRTQGQAAWGRLPLAEHKTDKLADGLFQPEDTDVIGALAIAQHG